MYTHTLKLLFGSPHFQTNSQVNSTQVQDRLRREAQASVPFGVGHFVAKGLSWPSLVWPRKTHYRAKASWKNYVARKGCPLGVAGLGYELSYKQGK